jgi:DNA-binding response OmpR family regulator
MDVVLVRWPADGARRAALRAGGVPRLLLVEEGEEPPPPDDCLEDWVRVPAPESEVRARAAALVLRARRHVAGQPVLDGDGVLRFGGRWVALPPIEARIARLLVERFGAVVGRETLARAGWPAGAPGRNALDVHMLRFRRRVEPLGLVVRTVRSRGYALEAPLPERP